MTVRLPIQRLRLQDVDRDTEVLLGILRLAVLPLLLGGSLLPHGGSDRLAFLAVFAGFALYALSVLGLVLLNRVDGRLGLATTAIDILAVAALSFLSGGATSEARRAFSLIPILVAFRLTPWLTAASGAGAALAYCVQALGHRSSGQPRAYGTIALVTSYVIWVGFAAALLSTLLQRRAGQVRLLADARRALLVEVQEAEERERRALAEALHDSSIQNLLSVRHALAEAGAGSVRSDALGRADEVLVQTIDELRNVLFELHPYLLDEVGLAAALRAAAERFAAAGGFRIEVDAVPSVRRRHDRLLYSAARELLTNAARHARASTVGVQLREENGSMVLRIVDDGCGFSATLLSRRLEEGHVGLASQRERIERAGGTLTVETAFERGTAIEVRVPA